MTINVFLYYYIILYLIYRIDPESYPLKSSQLVNSCHEES
jgi:hypothetical protein